MSPRPEISDTLRLIAVGIALRQSGMNLIHDLSLEIRPGEIVTIMGPSGSGKSTLLAYIGGFLDKSAFEARGEVFWGDRLVSKLSPEQRHFGLLFQDSVLFPHLSVGGNLLFGLPRDCFKTAFSRRKAAEEALVDIGLRGFFDRDPASLSGGQKARVALLRTLLSEPHALLLDEPFGKLDTALRAEFRALVFRHAQQRGLPTLLVTHDQGDADAAGGKIIDLP